MITKVASIDFDTDGNITRLTFASDCAYDNEDRLFSLCASHAEDDHSLEGGPHTRRSAHSFS